jgi:hypothetical protein
MPEQVNASAPLAAGLLEKLGNDFYNPAVLKSSHFLRREIA